MNTADIIALSSAIIAICAFTTTFWQAWLTHRHNKLSVRPLLTWHIQRQFKTNKARLKVSIHNLGLGPALILDRYFEKDATRFHPKVNDDEVKEFLAHIFGQKIQYHIYEFGLPGIQGAIPSQGELVIADVEFPSLLPESLPVIIEMIGNSTFVVHYESMYRESFSMTVK